MTYFRRLFSRLFQFDVSGAESSRSFELVYRRFCAYVFNCAMLVVLLASTLLNLYEEIPVSFASWIIFLGPLASLFWLWKKPLETAGPLGLLIGSLMLWGVLLLLGFESSDWGSLFYFAIFPFAMCCAGLRRGFLYFALFYAFLLLLLFSPLSVHLQHPMPRALKLHLLLGLGAAFVLAVGLEFIRGKISAKLDHAMFRLEREALMDPLTGLGNRRDFQNYFSLISGKSARDGQPFSLVMVDIDRFKRVNDTYGHEAGDQVLRHIAAVVTKNLRAMDRMFRWGGEEFILLLPDTSTNEAKMAAERVRAAVASSPCRYGDTEVHCTISLGVHSGGIQNSYGKMDEQIASADHNLYQAKTYGGNRVVG